VTDRLEAAEMPLAAEAASLRATSTLADGEVVLLSIKPSYWFVVLKRSDVLLTIPIVTLAAYGIEQMGWMDVHLPTIVLASVACMACVLAWLLLDRATRSYVLTDRRVSREAGVLDRLRVELPLRKVQTVVVYRSLIERVLGVGTILISSAASGSGSSGGDVAWYLIASPQKHARTLRDALDRYGNTPPSAGATPPTPSRASS
jgi:uncharacterized membrane protein YdbT with pleckstrin-like domain